MILMRFGDKAGETLALLSSYMYTDAAEQRTVGNFRKFGGNQTNSTGARRPISWRVPPAANNPTATGLAKFPKRSHQTSEGSPALLCRRVSNLPKPDSYSTPPSKPSTSKRRNPINTATGATPLSGGKKLPSRVPISLRTPTQTKDLTKLATPTSHTQAAGARPSSIPRWVPANSKKGAQSSDSRKGTLKGAQSSDLRKGTLKGAQSSDSRKGTLKGAQSSDWRTPLRKGWHSVTRSEAPNTSGFARTLTSQKFKHPRTPHPDTSALKPALDAALRSSVTDLLLEQLYEARSLEEFLLLEVECASEEEEARSLEEFLQLEVECAIDEAAELEHGARLVVEALRLAALVNDENNNSSQSYAEREPISPTPLWTSG